MNEAKPASGCTGPSDCSALGKLHKWWLREFGPHTKLMVGYGYAGTPYGKAIIGLMNRGLVEFDAGFGDMGLIRLTPEGIRIKSEWSNAKAESLAGSEE